jgi:anti-anti-sigma factor
MSLTMETLLQESHTVITASGELDLASASALRELVLGRIEAGERCVIFDLSGLTFCDSAGLTVFVQAKNRSDELGGEIRLAAPTGIVQRVLEISGLADALPVYPTLADAQAATAAR